ncbi:MAG: AtpZ/AtpI family protein [Anaerolineae bacterium]|nr:AtpZ/AtpI family protein [Thermoflexales bacterium]MDW8407078.1 AtpZ/AtpI family protein [Anaerolineae bacterium]
MGNDRESPIALLIRALPPAIVGAMVVQIAFVVGGLVLGSILLGLFIDSQLSTRPLFTLGLGIVSLPLSVWLTYRIALRAIAKARAAYEAHLRSKAAKAGQADSPAASQVGALPASR